MHFPSEISTVTGDFTLLTIQFLSHGGSSLPAVGTDNQTWFPLLCRMPVVVHFLPVCRLHDVSLHQVLKLSHLCLQCCMVGWGFIASGGGQVIWLWVPSVHQLEWGHASGTVCSSPVRKQGQKQLFPVLLLLSIRPQQLEQ